jgi:hypothetical protein
MLMTVVGSPLSVNETGLGNSTGRRADDFVFMTVYRDVCARRKYRVSRLQRLNRQQFMKGLGDAKSLCWLKCIFDEVSLQCQYSDLEIMNNILQFGNLKLKKKT